MLWLQLHFHPTLIPMPPSISWSMHPILQLEQYYNSRLMMIGNQSLFFPRSLSPRERKYSTFDRELLATFLAVKHFQHHLHNPNFHILTDHKPLIYAINSFNTHHAKHIGWIIFPSLQRIFDTFNGVQNPVADAFSRMQANVSMPSPTVPISELARQQHTDVELQSYLKSPNSLNLVTETFNHVSLICDISTGNPRPFVPSNFDVNSLLLFTISRIQVFVPHKNSSRNVLFDHA